MVTGGHSTKKCLSTCYENIMKVSNLNIPQPEEYDASREARNARIRTLEELARVPRERRKILPRRRILPGILARVWLTHIICNFFGYSDILLVSK